MRFPKLPGRNESAETHEAAPSAALAPQHTGMSSVPIPEQAPPPLTSELTRSIRFSVSAPQGYYFEQVETFVQQVIEVLDFYEQADYRWRQALYDLQVEVDQQAFDNQRLRSEIELFKVQGSPLVNADGSYVTESQASALATTSANLDAVRDQLASSEQARIAGQEEMNRLADLVAMQEQEIAALRSWGEQVVADMQALQAHAANLEAQMLAAQQAPAPPAPVVQPVVVETPHHSPLVEHPSGEPLPPAEVPVHVAPAVEPVAYPPVLTVPEVDIPEVATPVASTAAPGEPRLPAAPVEQDVTAAPTGSTHEHTPTAETPAEYHPADQYEQGIEVPDLDLSALDGYEWEPRDSSHAVESADEAPAAHDELLPVEYLETSSEPTAPEVPVHLAEPVPGAEVIPEPEPAPEEPVSEEPAVAWSPDSELPDGVALPGTGEAAITYPPAAPGVPLETHGVALDVWAPELDPRIKEALAEQARAQAAAATPSQETGQPEPSAPETTTEA